MSSANVRLLFWMNMPSHHQAGFLASLRNAGVDTAVLYYGDIDERRRALGWADCGQLPDGEFRCRSLGELDHLIPDWRRRLHIVPGYGSVFLRRLVRFLVGEQAHWAHWSEPAQHGLRWLASFPLKFWYARQVNHHACVALAIGRNAARDFVRWGIRAEKIEQLPYAVPQPEVRPSQNEYADICAMYRVTFLFLGELCQRKGVDLLLQAFAALAHDYLDAGLLLVGHDSSAGKYSRSIAMGSFVGRIHFMPATAASNIGAAIQASSVMVLPSRHDGWGMVIAESVALGKPIIATTACGAAWHLVESGVNGYRVPVDKNAIADAMRLYLRNDVLIAEHGAASRAIFESYTPEANAVRLLDILAKRDIRCE